MKKDAALTRRLEPELREAFQAETTASHCPSSQVVRKPMPEFVQRQSEVRAHKAFLQRKVAMAREQIRAGEYADADSVEGRFAARRSALLGKMNAPGA